LFFEAGTSEGKKLFGIGLHEEERLQSTCSALRCIADATTSLVYYASLREPSGFARLDQALLLA